MKKPSSLPRFILALIAGLFVLLGLNLYYAAVHAAPLLQTIGYYTDTWTWVTSSSALSPTNTNPDLVGFHFILAKTSGPGECYFKSHASSGETDYCNTNAGEHCANTTSPLEGVILKTSDQSLNDYVRSIWGNNMNIVFNWEFTSPEQFRLHSFGTASCEATVNPIYYGIPPSPTPDLTLTAHAPTAAVHATQTAAMATGIAMLTATPGACSEAIDLFPKGPGLTMGTAGPTAGDFSFLVYYDDYHGFPFINNLSWGATVAVPTGQQMHADLEVFDKDNNLLSTTPHTFTANADTSQTIPFSIMGDQPVTIRAHFYGTCDGCMIEKVILDADTSTSCITPAPTTPTAGHWIQDGDMEQYPRSSYWINKFTGYDNNWPNGGEQYTEGRLSYTNLFNRLSNGAPACDNGFHAVGVVKGFLTGNHPTSPIKQAFTWDGGDLYWKTMVRGSWGGLLPIDIDQQSHAMVTLYDSDGNKTVLVNNRLLSSSWETVSGHLYLPAGYYTLELDRGTIYSYGDDTVYYDNTWVSNRPIPSGCNRDTDVLKPTATPTPPLTPTAGDGGLTNTPGPSPTIPPKLIDIINCGFLAGENGWGHNSQSSLGTTGGPVGAQYAIAKGSSPAWWQNFSTSQGNTTALKAFVRGSVAIQFTNTSTNAHYAVISGTYGSWTQVSGSVYIPAGSYRVELNTTGTEGDFDGIVISQNGFVDQTCLRTPTPGPTSFVTLTPTPTGVWRTYTPTPTQTGTLIPYATYTSGPGPTLNPGTATAISGTLSAIHATQTSIAKGTGTPIPGTSTPGTGTPVPGSTYVPGPVPDEPAPGFGVGCNRPSSPLDIAHWIDYEVCVTLSWASWGPSHSATAQAIPNAFNDREPFGTIKEVQGVGTTIKGYLNAYEWDYNTEFINGNTEPDINPFLPGADSPWNGGKITLRGATSPYLTSCNLELTKLTGYRLGPSLCFIFDILRRLSLLSWFQSFINVSALIALGLYIKRSWIDKGMIG